MYVFLTFFSPYSSFFNSGLNKSCSSAWRERQTLPVNIPGHAASAHRALCPQPPFPAVPPRPCSREGAEPPWLPSPTPSYTSPNHRLCSLILQRSCDPCASGRIRVCGHSFCVSSWPGQCTQVFAQTLL